MMGDFEDLVDDHPELHMQTRLQKVGTFIGNAIGYTVLAIVVFCLVTLLVVATVAAVHAVH